LASIQLKHGGSLSFAKSQGDEAGRFFGATMRLFAIALADHKTMQA
jgi:hypothetical protein